MIRRLPSFFFILLAVVWIPFTTMADSIADADALYEQGGMKNKTQRSFEKSYELDKMYAAAGSILALGRFWAVLPWPMANSKKPLAYYLEYQQPPYFQEGAEGRVYLAELLVSMGGKAYQAEARRVLEPALQAPDPYFRNRARRAARHDQVKGPASSPGTF